MFQRSLVTTTEPGVLVDFIKRQTCERLLSWEFPEIWTLPPLLSSTDFPVTCVISFSLEVSDDRWQIIHFFWLTLLIFSTPARENLMDQLKIRSWLQNRLIRFVWYKSSRVMSQSKEALGQLQQWYWKQNWDWEKKTQNILKIIWKLYDTPSLRARTLYPDLPDSFCAKSFFLLF